MEQPFLNSNAKAGTLGGTFLVLLCNINMGDLFTSAILAAVGAAVSFGVSVFLKWLVNRFRRK